MKIVYVSPYPPMKDGIGDYTYSLVSAAAAVGDDARIIVPRALPNYSQEVSGAIGVRRHDLHVLCDMVAAWQPDIIHVQFAIAAFGAMTSRLISLLKLLRSELRLPIVATMHEVTRDT